MVLQWWAMMKLLSSQRFPQLDISVTQELVWIGVLTEQVGHAWVCIPPELRGCCWTQIAGDAAGHPDSMAFQNSNFNPHCIPLWFMILLCNHRVIANPACSIPPPTCLPFGLLRNEFQSSFHFMFCIYCTKNKGLGLFLINTAMKPLSYFQIHTTFMFVLFFETGSPYKALALELAIRTRLTSNSRGLPIYASQILGLKGCVMPSLTLFLWYLISI